MVVAVNDLITIEEFLTEEKACINCKTEQEATKLINEFKTLGFNWADPTNVNGITLFDEFTNNTCYDISSGTIKTDMVQYYNNHHYTIYNFIDIDFNNISNIKVYPINVTSTPHYNCYNTIDFMHEKQRLCKSHNYDCIECELHKENIFSDIECKLDSHYINDKYINELQYWSNCHSE